MEKNERFHSEKETISEKNAQNLDRNEETIRTDVERKEKELRNSTIGGF